MAQTGIESKHAQDFKSNPGRNRIVLFGDSLTESQVSVSTLQDCLGSAWEIVNRGFGGDTTATMYSRLSRDVLSVERIGACIVLGGVNDLGAGRTAAQIEGSLQAIYTALWENDIKVIAQTVLPFGGAAWYAGAYQVIADAVNLWIMQAALYVNIRMNTYASMEDNASADHLHSAWDFGDGVHLTIAGREYLQFLDYTMGEWGVL